MADHAIESILHVCVEQNHIEELEFLLQNSSSATMPNNRWRIEVTTSVDEPVLQDGVIYMNLTEKEDSLLFLDEGIPDVNLNFELLSETPLHIAAFLGRVECFELLHLYGASLDIKNHHGESPLHLAVIHGKNDIVSILLLKREFKYFTQQTGNTKQNVLHLACLCGKNEIVRNIVQNLNDYSPETLEQIFNQKDQNGEYPIHIAARKGETSVIEILLQTDKNFAKRVDEEKRNILHIATMHGKQQIVKMILETKIDLVNQQDAFGWTPLHIASMLKLHDIEKLLLHAGASPEIQNSRKLTPNQFSTLEALEAQIQKFMDEIGGNLEDVEAEINEQLASING